MSIRIYDFDYNLLAEADRAFSREWNLRFNGIGSFEGSFDVSGGLCGIFSGNKYLILTDGDKQCVCTASKAGERLFIYGRTPEWLLSKRVVLPFKSREIFGDSYTDPETIALRLLNDAYKTPHAVAADGTVNTSKTDDVAVCADLILPESGTADKLDRHFWRNAANKLSDVIGDLCELADEGYRLKFCPDEKLWRFEFVRGTQRDLIISKSLKNAYDMSLTRSVLDSADGGFFELYDSTDSEVRSYGYLAGTDGGSGLLKWDTILASASGESEARKLLAKCIASDKIDCEVTGAAYGVDYELGDTLRVQAEIGGYRATLKSRVTGVSIISDAGGISTKPEFTQV